jgi:hypothetical protein
LPYGHSPPTACKHAVSGTISLPSQGYFSPFPHGTSSLSVASEYLALPDGPGRFPQGSTCPAVLRSHLKLRSHFKIQGYHLLRPAFPSRSRNAFLSLVRINCGWNSSLQPPFILCGPATPRFPFESHGLGCSEFARHYYRNHYCFLFLGVLRWFTSPRSLQPAMYSPIDKPVTWFGFPHSDIPGYQIACISPGLIAASHVLHRLLAPRHPHACS